jgi:hypothetical protein
VSDFYWARPAGLLALLLPLAVWWLARRPRPPAEVATGTLAVWREVAVEALPAARRRRAPWLLLAALGLGALALAGPRTSRAGSNNWRVVVDRSPSMHLPIDARGAAQGAAGGATRLERALALAEVELERRGARAPTYLAYDGVDFVAADGALPEAWRRPPALPHPEPDWSRVDRARTLWVTDQEPATQPRHAGLVLSGGELASGPAAVAPDGMLLDFDGQELRPSARRAAGRALWIDATVPAPVRALAELWAAERGLDLAAAPDTGGVALAIAAPPPGAREPLAIGRDGWELEVRALAGGLPRSASRADVASDFELAPTPWLGGPVVLVQSAPGHIELAFDESSEPRGDPAAFALSWSALFDACLLPPREVVPVAERLAAGDERVGIPAEEERPAQAGSGLEALCAGGAALLVLAAWWLARRRST